MTISTSIFKTAITSAGSFFGGIQTYLIVGAVTAAVAFAGGSYAGYRWEHGEVLKLQLSDAQTVTKAMELAAQSQHRQDSVDQEAAVAEASAQGDIKLRQYQLHQKANKYVTPHQDATVCIPVGLVRLLNAAVLQTDPDKIKLAAGKFDDACSEVKASMLGDAVVEWLYTGHHNGEQLTALQAWIVANQKAQVAP